MPDLTEAQRERLAEALRLHTFRLRPSPARGIERCCCGESKMGQPGWHREHQRDALALVVAAIADEAAAEALDQRNEALDRLSDRTRAKWEAEARYAALVDKVRALADKWGGYGHGRYNVHLEERLPCPACDLLAELRELLEADQ